MVDNNDISFNLTFEDVFSDRVPTIAAANKTATPAIISAATPINNKSNASIKQFATIKDFKIAHNTGKFLNSQTGSTFKTALDEITNGKKTSHWMWYILPSDTNATSDTSIFFKLGPKSKNKLTITDYLDDNTLCTNYIKIINAIYNYLYIHKKLTQNGLKTMFGIDYTNGKLHSSISNFKGPLTEKLKNNNNNTVTKIEALYKISNPKTKT